MTKETLIKWLGGRIASLLGTRNLAVHSVLSRFLRAVRLALHPARSFNQRFPKQIYAPSRHLQNPTLIPIFIAIFFGCAILFRGMALLALAGANWTSDSQVFVLFGRLLRDFPDPMPLYLRTPPYLIVNALALSDISLTPILIFQAALAGLSAGFLVYAVAIGSRFAGVLIGCALFFDFEWATSQRLILIEGPLASFQLLTLAILVLHYAKPNESLKVLYWSGVTYCWCMLFRQSNLPLLLPILLFYAYRYRTTRHVAAVGLGMLSLLIALSSLNYMRTGEWRLWAQGGWYAEFPMFQLDMFSSENGPKSKAIAENLINCGITNEPSSLRFVSQGVFESCMLKQEAARIASSKEVAAAPIENAAPLPSNGQCARGGKNVAPTNLNYESWYKGIKCAYSNRDWAFEDKVASQLSAAYYGEALPKNLGKVPKILWREVPRFLAVRTYTLPSQLWLLPLWSQDAPDHICPFDWCNRQHFSPTYPFDVKSILAIQELAKWPTQFYMALADVIFERQANDLKIFGVFLALSMLILASSSGMFRFLGVIVISTILYNAIITILANVLILRYTSPMSSLYAIHGGLVVYAAAALARSLFCRVTGLGYVGMSK